MNDAGPTKEGKYWIDTCCTASSANAKRHKWWSPIKEAWGDYSWHLRPYPETDMSGEKGPREGFFIHGGTVWGSKGCIDLKNNDVSFNNQVVTKVTLPKGETCCFIDIVVKYVVKSFSLDDSVIVPQQRIRE